MPVPEFRLRALTPGLLALPWDRPLAQWNVPDVALRDIAVGPSRHLVKFVEADGVLWAVKEKAKPGRKLAKRQQARNRRFGKVRAKVEHVFRVMKCQFGYRKVRYRGIAKNGAQVFSLLALANLYLARRTFASA